MKFKMRKIISFVLAVTMIVTAFSEINLDVQAANGIEYHGKVSYGGSTVGRFTVNGQLAFCAEHDKTSPSTGTSFYDEIYHNEDIKKVLYYGWGGAEQWGGFESEAHGIVATSLMLSHYYSGTNVKRACQSFYDWLQTQPNAPITDISLSKSNVESYVEGNVQRTENIVFNADSRNSVYISLPEGVVLHSISFGTNRTGNVEVAGGETFYLTAPLSLNDMWNSGEIKGKIKEYQPVISVTVSEGLQNLVWNRVTDPSASINLTVKWSAVGYLEIQKTDSITGQALSGAVYGIYRDSNCTDLAEQLTLDNSGYGLSGQLVTGRYYVKEIKAPSGYKLDTNVYTYDVPAGQTVRVGVKDERVTGSITVTKKDNTTGNTVSGAEFGLYAAETITHPDGKTGTLYNKNQLVAKFPVTGNNGQATLNNLYLGKYYVKEIKAPQGYTGNSTSYPVTLNYAGQNVFVVTGSAEVKNDRVKGSITIQKTDKETGTAQGDAVLKGAVYGLYAADNISHPDGKTGTLYRTDQLIAKFPAVDEAGKAMLENLYLGKYYVKEITPSNGYLLDDTKYPVTLSYQSQNVPVITKNQTVKEQVVKGNIQLVKHLQESSGNTKPQKPEKGAEFQIILKSTKEVIQTITTNSDGFAFAKNLPYGTYIVHQTKGKEGYNMVDDFEVKVQADGRTYSYILENVHYSANLKVVKKDAETGETVAIAGAEFQILDSKNELVEQNIYYPSREKISEFKTDDNGMLMLPEPLVYGDYTLVETSAPDGYLIADPIPFTVSKAETVTDEWGDEIIIVNCSDVSVKGKIKIEKTGKVLTGFKDGKFIYEKKGLKDCVFRVTAAETIYSPDHATDVYGNRNILYEKGEVITELTTNGKGKAESERLPLGKYEVEEVSAPEGFLKESEKQKVELKYKDQETELVFATDTVYNENQEYQIAVEKTDSRTEKPLSGAGFSLYAGQNILNTEGKVIVKKDGKICMITTDTEGKAVTDSNLPTNVYVSEKDKPMYYLVETGTPEGYASDDTRYNILGKAGEEKKLTIKKEKVANKPIQVLFLKEDSEGNPLLGAVLQVREKEAGLVKSFLKNDVIEEWTTDGKPHVIYNLKAGKTYVLEEVSAPEGYTLAEPVEFTVEDTKEVQKIVMQDKKTEGKILLHKTEEATGKDLAGAVFELRNEDGKVLEVLTTDEAGRVRSKEYPIGIYKKGQFEELLKYYLVETQAPEGYLLDETPHEVTFEWKDGTKQVVEVNVDITNKPTEEKLPQTGDNTPAGILAGAALLSGTVLAGGIFYRKRQKETDEQ